MAQTHDISAARPASAFLFLTLLGAVAASPAHAGGAESLPGGCPPIGMASCGNPIAIATMNKIETVTDYESGGENKLTLKRYYNSIAGSPPGMFNDWRTNYDRGLGLDLNTNDVEVVRPDGKDIYFLPDGSGGWKNSLLGTDLRLKQVNATTWTLTDWNDTVETYVFPDASGNGFVLASSISSRNGYTRTLQYGPGNYQPISVTDSYGRKLTFAYDSVNQRISSVTTPDGRKLSYTYAGANDRVLAQVDYPSTPVTNRKYLHEDTTWATDEWLPLTGIIDENGSRFATFGYDDTVQVRPYANSSQHAGGAELTTLCCASGEPENQQVTVTQPSGVQEIYKSASVGTLTPYLVSEIDRQASSTTPAMTEKFTYDANGYPASVTDWNGNVTKYVYDTHGNETSRTEAFGTPQARTITTTWSATFHLPIEIDEPGRTTSFAYDANGNRLSKTVQAANTTSTWHYTYNATGEVLTATDPDGNVTHYAYDAKGNLTSISNALGQVTSYASYDANGRPGAITDPNGLTTTLTYNFRGQVTSARAGTWVTILTYDAVGQLVRLTRPDGSFVNFKYDAAHRLIAVSDALHNLIVYTLDAAGNRSKTQVFDPAGNLVRTGASSYDAIGRLLRAVGAAGEVSKYAHDANGNLTGIADPLGNLTVAGYDALNRVIQVNDAAGGITRSAYDPLDRVIAVADPRSLLTRYAYNGLDLPTVALSPDAGRTTRAYDAAGNLTVAVDGRGQRSVYVYDALNRVTQAKFADGSSIFYRYDQGTNGIGRRTQMIDPTGSTTWAYDAHGLVFAKTQKTGAVTLTTRYAHDQAGRLTTITYPSGARVSYAYDADGRPDLINYQPPGGSTVSPLLSHALYFPFGAPERWLQGDGALYARTFDKDGRITHIAFPAGHQVALAYDAAGRITFLSESGLAGKAFTYDALGRLTKYVDGSASQFYQTYAYDKNGNRTQTSRVTGGSPLTYAYTYDSKSNRLLKIAGAASEIFTYDGVGDLSTDKLGTSTTTFTYDARNRMSASTGGGVSLTYEVNGLGERVVKANTSGGAAGQMSLAFDPAMSIFVYDEKGHPIGEYDGAGAVRQEIVWLGDLPVAVIDSGTVYFIAPDHLGAPHQITNAAQAVVWLWDHDPFGNGQPSGSLTFNHRFPGQYADAATGLHYNGMRDYNPAIGRYIESDPIGLAGGINLYAYVEGNPLSRIDPAGTDDIGSPGASPLDLLKQIADAIADKLHPANDRQAQQAIQDAIKQIQDAQKQVAMCKRKGDKDALKKAKEKLAAAEAAERQARLAKQQNDDAVKALKDLENKLDPEQWGDYIQRTYGPDVWNAIYNSSRH